MGAEGKEGVLEERGPKRRREESEKGGSKGVTRRGENESGSVTSVAC